MAEIDRNSKIEATTFQNGYSCSFTTTAGELIDEINHYQAFFLSSVGGVYSTSQLDTKRPRAAIHTKGLTPEIRDWLSKRMRG